MTAPGSPSGVRLAEPLYGASPVQSITRFFRKYGEFSGRASRSEYWWTTLALAIASVALGAIGLVAGIPGSVDGQPGPGFGVFSFVVIVGFFGLLIPSISLGARRLHDANFSAWLLLLNFVPYLGPLALLILSAVPTNPAARRFDGPGSLLTR